MSEQPEQPKGVEPPRDEQAEQDAEARAFVLSRRAKFVAAAVASGLAGTAYVAHNWPQPCLTQALSQEEQKRVRSRLVVQDDGGGTDDEESPSADAQEGADEEVSDEPPHR